MKSVSTTWESLFTAQQSGADRIELCSALGLGGLTPSYGFMQQAARHATVPVYAMIRPRAGDFCFNDGEFEMMLQDIAAARSAGLQGVVVGLLDEEGRVPAAKLKQLVDAAGPLGATFHRAIDLSSDWRLDLETIVAAGCERILSSGHAPTALAGLETLQEMQQALAGACQPDAGGRGSMPTTCVPSSSSPSERSAYVRHGLARRHGAPWRKYGHLG